jgi:hypothetical protein
MKTLQTLYPVLFPEKLVLQQLNKDLDDAVNQTRRVMVRLGIKDGSVENFLLREIEYHGGDVNNCKDRKTSGVISILWLNRILWFVTNVVINIINKHDRIPIKHAYEQTLRRYHGYLASKLFDTLLCVCTSSKRTIHDIRHAPMDHLSTVNTKLYRIYMKNFNIIMSNRANFPDKI